MRYFIILLLPAVAHLYSQESNTSVQLPKFQEFANPNDERFKVFLELEAKSEANDVRALEELGNYYLFGLFPVIQNQARAIEIWTKGARLGSSDCAQKIANAIGLSTESSSVIERQKWLIISQKLRWAQSKAFNKGQLKIQRSENVSEGSFAEALRLADSFLAGVSGSPAGPSAELEPDFSVPRFRDIKAAQAFRMALQTDFRKVQSPLYLRQNLASPGEIAAYSKVILKVKKVQDSLRSSLDFDNFRFSGPQADHSRQKVSELRQFLINTPINAQAPFTRQDLNKAQVFLDRYRDLLDTIEKGL